MGGIQNVEARKGIGGGWGEKDAGFSGVKGWKDGRLLAKILKVKAGVVRGTPSLGSRE